MAGSPAGSASQSKVGQYLDPVADKILLTCIYVGLALGGAVPLWIVLLIIARDLWILLLSGVALRFTEFRNLQPSLWGKASTFFQIMAAVSVMAARAYSNELVPEDFHNPARRRCDPGSSQRNRLQPPRRGLFSADARFGSPSGSTPVDLKPGWEYP